MQTEQARKIVTKFPLRLMPSIRDTAKAFSLKEGVSLNQFINVAVAEKVAQLRHEEWVQNCKKPTQEDVTVALRLLDKAGGQPPEPGDELPDEYVRLDDRRAKSAGRKRRTKVS